MDEEPNAKRIRSRNFTEEEKHLLLRLVTKYRNVIESKKSDSANWKDKNEAWNRVATEFNSRGIASPRPLKSLKKYYDNLKKVTRKEARERREQNKTGDGGPLFFFPPDEDQDLLVDIINKKSLYGLENEFDSDANEFHLQTRENQENMDDDYSEINESEASNSNAEINKESDPLYEQQDWGDCKPPIHKDLKNAKSDARSNRNWAARRRPITKNYNCLAKRKMELVNLQIAAFKEEATLRAQALKVDLDYKKVQLEIAQEQLQQLKKSD